MRSSGHSLTLRGRTWLLAVTLAIVFSVVTGVATTLYVRRDRQRTDLRDRLLPAQLATQHLSTAYADQQRGVLGFVLSRESSFLGPYTAGAATADKDTATVRRLLAPWPSLVADLDRVDAAADGWRQQAATPELTAAQASADPVDAFLVDRGRALFDLVQAALMNLRDDVNDRTATVQELASTSYRALGLLAVAGAGLWLMSLVLAIVLLRVWVTKPLQQIRNSLQAVSDGHLTTPIEAVGPPEVAAVASDAEHMRMRIVDQLRRTQQAYEALDQEAPVVQALGTRLAPSPWHPVAGLDVAVATRAAEGLLAGDWYDTLDLGGPRRGFTVVDVSGHGALAGLLALEMKSQLLAALALRLAPGDALTWLSRQLGDTDELFATIAVVEIDPVSGQCSYASAGHPPLLLLGPRGIAQLEPTGPLMGPFVDSWETGEFQLAQGESVLIYTDGVTEARDADGVELGWERLADIAFRFSGGPAAAIVDACVSATFDFAGPRLSDDGTILVAKRV